MQDEPYSSSSYTYIKLIVFACFYYLLIQEPSDYENNLRVKFFNFILFIFTLADVMKKVEMLAHPNGFPRTVVEE